jgi:hypothetical protein
VDKIVKKQVEYDKMLKFCCHLLNEPFTPVPLYRVLSQPVQISLENR